MRVRPRSITAPAVRQFAGVDGEFLPGIPELVHLGPYGHVRGLVVYLFQEMNVFIPGFPVPQSPLLRDDPAFQKLVLHALYPGHLDALAYLAWSLLAVELGRIDGLHRAQVDTLAGITFRGGVCEVMARYHESLLMGNQAPFAYFDSGECGLHPVPPRLQRRIQYDGTGSGGYRLPRTAYILPF